MDDTAVADLERNAWSMFSFIGMGPGGGNIDTPTRLVVESPLTLPPYNGVFRFYDEGDRPVPEQVEELFIRFVDRGVDPVWLVHPTTADGVREALTSVGMECAEELYGMSTDVVDVESPPAPDGVEVMELSADEPEHWLDLVSWRYGLEEQMSSYLREVYRWGITENATRVWVALIDGRPVSKVGTHVTDDVVGIYGVATTEDGRGRGLASLLCATAIAEAATDGAKRAVLHSTPMARSLYRRMGYDDVATFELWAVRDTLHL